MIHASGQPHLTYVKLECTEITYPNSVLQIYNKMLSEAYTPRIWRTHELHLLPPDPFNASDPKTRDCLNWIFVISSLNFSFWSDKEESECYGVEWRESWTSNEQTVWTGYWSLVAAINRGLEVFLTEAS